MNEQSKPISWRSEYNKLLALHGQLEAAVTAQGKTLSQQGGELDLMYKLNEKLTRDLHEAHTNKGWLIFTLLCLGFGAGLFAGVMI